ncbi:MAG: acyl carrier protein [Alphaproteobacteria bacterium]|nr:acyl carrier protein [Alphaproteobacteria bacterium]
MTENSLTNEILDIIADKAMVERDKLDPAAKLTDLNISSLDVVEIVFALEDKYAVQLPFNANAENKEFETLGQVVKLVEQQIAIKQGGAKQAGAAS